MSSTANVGMTMKLKGIILEALLECPKQIEIGYVTGYVKDLNTPDLEAVAEFVAEFLERKGFDD